MQGLGLLVDPEAAEWHGHSPEEKGSGDFSPWFNRPLTVVQCPDLDWSLVWGAKIWLSLSGSPHLLAEGIKLLLFQLRHHPVEGIDLQAKAEVKPLSPNSSTHEIVRPPGNITGK